jgi:hypothetical protein
VAHTIALKTGYLRDGTTQVYKGTQNTWLIACPGEGRQAWTNTGYGSIEASQTERLFKADKNYCEIFYCFADISSDAKETAI